MGAQRVDGRAMRQVHVMGGLAESAAIGQPGRMPGHAVTEQGEDRWLVEGREAPHAIAVARGDQRSIVGEPSGDVAVEPSAPVLERLRQVPVIQAEPGFDAGRQQPVDQAIVEGEAGLVHRPASRRHDARPGDGEPVGLHADPAHQRNVLGEAMVVVAGDIAGIAIGDAAGNPAIAVPDAGAPPVGRGGAFDLIARGRNAPDEVASQASRTGDARYRSLEQCQRRLLHHRGSSQGVARCEPTAHASQPRPRSP